MSNSFQKLEIDAKYNSKTTTANNNLINNNQLQPIIKQNKKIDNSIIVKSLVPKDRQLLLKWNGWGYNDSKFVVQNGIIHFTGSRYPIGNLSLPYFTEWVKEVFDVDLDLTNKSQEPPDETKYPPSNVTEDVLIKIESFNIPYSTKGIDRLLRAHGHTLHDIYTLRMSSFDRIPDVVVWPSSHEDVVSLVNFANGNNIVIIPFGGGTSVTSALECPKYERRTVISLDTSQMNRILWVDSENLIVCCESGIVGQDLEKELQKLGYTTGHEPDSYEFSSLGGWVATRASGMKKNTYGNIEDIVIHVKMVTPKGLLQKNCQVPRLSCGPDFHHVILGSEGTLGVITEVILKVRPLPKFKKYGSVIFPSFEAGVKCMREVARERCQPASIRLMDNDQFKFGQALRPKPSYFGLLLDNLKRAYITKIKGFDVNSMCVMTLLFEGNKDDVEENEKKINRIAAKYEGIPAGEKNGERGYLLTFVIAYIRDLGLEYYVVSESFETSVPWDRTITLCHNVKSRVSRECKRYGITHYMLCSRVTQTYDAGSVVYFYFGFNYRNLKNPVEVYEDIESKARDEIIASGGSLSHHHGVGKIRKKWYPSTVSDVGVALFNAAKRELDPNNVFASGNLSSKL